MDHRERRARLGGVVGETHPSNAIPRLVFMPHADDEGMPSRWLDGEKDVERGLLMGLLYSIAERTLNKGTGRPMVIMISLGLLTWLFRCFRDVTFPELWALLLGFMVLTGLIWFGRIFASAKT